MKSSNVVFYSDTKNHYAILDGLRGVAALIVVMFHVFETFSGGDHAKQIINHGYLAVDFFFVLSGFVIGYAYDDRWGKMSVKDFFKRRLIRLHPMIIVAMIFGAIMFYFQQCDWMSKVGVTPVWQMLLVMLVGLTLIPLHPSMDIRGWGEMHPLNGPAWSLFFEYIANILYALFVRKFSKTLLSIFVFIFAVLLIHFAVTNPNGDVIGGWSFNLEQLRVGFTRLLYPFFAGLLLSRLVKPGRINNAFLWCSLILAVFLAMPRIGTHETAWMNGIYDSLVIIFIFPLIVFIGASGDIKGKISSKVCKFLGDISFPIYITHYPIIYTYTAWVANNKITLKDGGLAMGFVVLIVSVLLAYAIFRLYDLPIRKWLTNKFLGNNRKVAN